MEVTTWLKPSGNSCHEIRWQRECAAGYRFYALYDKIYRSDILLHAWNQCRANKGAPGVDGQDFEEVEKYGVQRWLGELALALKTEKYQPEPIRRVFIPKANGKLRPLGISTLRDRVCMTAAMLVLEPSLKRTFLTNSMPIAPGAMPSRRCCKSKIRCSMDEGKS